MLSNDNNPYLTDDEKEMLETYRRCTPEMKAEINRQMLLLAVGNDEEDEAFPTLNTDQVSGNI